MKNLILLFLSFSAFIFLPSTLKAQASKKEIKTQGTKRSIFHYQLSGNAQIEYLEFDDFVIRIERSVIQFLDENLKEVDRIELPTTEGYEEYSISKDDDRLYVLQESSPNVFHTEGRKHTLFIINLYDFTHYETHEITSTNPFNSITLLALKNQLFIALTNNKELTTLYKYEPKGNKVNNLDFKKFADQYSSEGIWLTPLILSDQLVISSYNQEKQISQSIYLDENFTLVNRESMIMDPTTNAYKKLDKNGEEMTSVAEMLTEGVAYPIQINNSTLWIKNRYTISKFTSSCETWVSYDENNFEINLTEHLKKEMKACGMNKSTGLNAPIIYADPINNSIVVQYWIIYYVQGQPVERFIYFNLNRRFFLRNAYKLKMTRYPIDTKENQQSNAYSSSILKNQMTFEINKTPKKWEGDVTNTHDNAFDFAFTQEKPKGLHTIIQMKKAQYLFIDRKDGSTTGYIFKKEN